MSSVPHSSCAFHSIPFTEADPISSDWFRPCFSSVSKESQIPVIQQKLDYFEKNKYICIMLAADKLQLQSALKQQATALKEKEFNLHRSNMGEFQIWRGKKWVGWSFCSFPVETFHISQAWLTFVSYSNWFVQLLYILATVGTIGAVLAGLDITMFIEFSPHDDSTWVSNTIHLSNFIFLVLY